jgi:hypothetical protein
MTLQGKITAFLILFFGFTMVPAALGTTSDLQTDINNFFVKIDASFARIVETGALRSTSLRPAERLFIREMRKNPVYTEFLRTNSKGVVISEVVRGQKVEQPMRNVADQRWFKRVSQKNEAYYTLIKDEDRGRFYLFWARPILKRGDRFVGAVVAKIDLWDSFYEFSNSTYVPFLIKLGRKSLFDHKWKNNTDGVEKELSIQGIDKISVMCAEEVKQPEDAVAAQKDTAARVAAAAAPAVTDQVSNTPKPPKKKGGSGILIFILVLLLAGIAIASFVLISWMRRRAFLKNLDEEDSDL